jgi:hypothetical protein
VRGSITVLVPVGAFFFSRPRFLQPAARARCGFVFQPAAAADRRFFPQAGAEVRPFRRSRWPVVTTHVIAARRGRFLTRQLVARPSSINCSRWTKASVARSLDPPNGELHVRRIPISQRALTAEILAARSAARST